MCDDSADLVCVVELDGAHGGRGAGGLQGVGLGEEALGRVVEEAAYYGGALDEPGRVSIRTLVSTAKGRMVERELGVKKKGENKRNQAE